MASSVKLSAGISSIRGSRIIGQSVWQSRDRPQARSALGVTPLPWGECRADGISPASEMRCGTKRVRGDPPTFSHRYKPDNFDLQNYIPMVVNDLHLGVCTDFLQNSGLWNPRSISESKQYFVDNDGKIEKLCLVLERSFLLPMQRYSVREGSMTNVAEAIQKYTVSN